MVNEQFCSLLDQEIAVLQEFTGLSLAKKEALLRNDLDALKKISVEEEKLTVKFKEIDNACSPQVQFFLNTKQADDLTEDVKERLAKLEKVALELKITNQFNQELLQDAIGLTKFTINMLTSTFSKSSHNYNPTGKTVNGYSDTNKNQLLDFKG